MGDTIVSTGVIKGIIVTAGVVARLAGTVGLTGWAGDWHAAQTRQIMVKIKLYNFIANLLIGIG
jgi:hypothetical protein